MKSVLKISISFGLCFFLFFIGSGTMVLAQEQKVDTTLNEQKVVLLNDGREYVGVILADDGREILLNSISVGKLYIKKDDIKSIRPVTKKSEMIGDVYIGNDLFSTRYFISTNGFTVKKKDTYVMLNLYGPEFQMAVTDHFSWGIMTTWAFAPFALTGKYSRELGNDFYWGVGFIGGSSMWIESFRFVGGLGFTSLTYGNRNYNLNLSFGGGFINDFKPRVEYMYSYTVNGTWYTNKRIIDRSGQAFLTSLSGTARLGKKASFVMENIFYTDTQRNIAVVMIPGFRYSSDDVHAFQFGVAGFFNNSNSVPIPMLSWFYKLN